MKNFIIAFILLLLVFSCKKIPTHDVTYYIGKGLGNQTITYYDFNQEKYITNVVEGQYPPAATVPDDSITFKSREGFRYFIKAVGNSSNSTSHWSIHIHIDHKYLTSKVIGANEKDSIVGIVQ